MGESEAEWLRIATLPSDYEIRRIALLAAATVHTGLPKFASDETVEKARYFERYLRGEV